MATYESRRYNTPVPDASKIADGSVNNTEFEHLDGVTSDIQTQINSKLNTTGGTITGNVTITDNDHLYIGDGQDIDILSDGSTGFIKGNDLRLQSSTGENYITTAINGATKLFHDNVLKAETTGSGLTVSGAMAATTVTGDGSALTSLNGSNIASGTVADARISTLTSSKLTGALPAIDGSALTGISLAPAIDAIGSIQAFMIGRPSNNSSATAADPFTISRNTELVPSTYVATPGPSDIYPMVISDYAGQLAVNPISGNPAGVTIFEGVATSQFNNTVSKSSKTGTWRLLGDAYYGKVNIGSGPNSATRLYANMFYMQRIS